MSSAPESTGLKLDLGAGFFPVDIDQLRSVLSQPSAAPESCFDENGDIDVVKYRARIQVGY